jgi:hypothetical protein
MQDMRDVVERLEPIPDERGDWGAVIRDARPRRRPVLVGSVAGVVVAAAALFALTLFEPWEGERQTLLERALAAVDDGPVLHVVLRGEWGGTLVDLKTGERTPVHGENETWYDPERELVHTISRLGDTVQHESLYDPGKAPPELVALGRDYRPALQSGSARVAGEDVIDGRPVTWITYRRELLPDSSDNKFHEWTQQVAVSKETFKPVAMRDTRDGKPGPGTLTRVIALEMLAAGEGDFTVEPRRVLDNVAFSEGRERITLDQAAEVLGRRPVWLGSEHSGLPLSYVSRKFVRTGRQSETLVTGPAAEDAKTCARAMRRGRARLETPACERMRSRRRGFGIRGDKVYEFGPIQWREEHTGVALFYGTAGDDPSTYHEDFVPLGDHPHVTITQSTQQWPFPRGGTYDPPAGAIFLAAGERNATFRADGLYVDIEASSEELILSAARALEPMPR